MTKRRRYKGILAEPLPWPKGRDPVGFEEDAIKGFISEKLRALLDHYGIDGGLSKRMNGWKLALKLAQEHVPGFRIDPSAIKRPKSGRPPEFEAGERDLLLYLQGQAAIAAKVPQREWIRQVGRDLREAGRCDWTDESIWRHYERLRRKIKGGEIPEGMAVVARWLQNQSGGN